LNPELIKFIQIVLKFNPKERPTARELLENDYIKEAIQDENSLFSSCSSK
jgi:hypothetical protein